MNGARKFWWRGCLCTSCFLMVASAHGGNVANLLFPPGTGNGVTLVDFFGDGPSGSGPATGPDQHNDDDSATVPLPFTFDLYGATSTTAFVNNNGNLSFGAFFSTFTSSGFPVSGFPMVAPFWADVDTGNSSNFIGDVRQEFFGTNTLVVTWDNVGYYNEHGDLRNTFQVAISDGTNASMGIGNNVCFSYDDMQWTTGDASGGSGGFGGTPATVGVNKGDGVDFFQIGRFDHSGSDYDGPGGNADGVDFLDGLNTCFAATSLSNQPPIAIGFPMPPKLDLRPGDLLNEVYSFIGPELGDAVTITSVLDPGGAQADGLSIVTVDGDPATATLIWTPGAGLVGNSYVLTFNFEDSVGATNSQKLGINIIPEPSSLVLILSSLLIVRGGFDRRVA